MRQSSVIVLVLLALLAAGCSQQTEAPELEFRATVSTEEVEKGRVERVLTTTGTVRARKKVDVLVENGGKLLLAKRPGTRERLAVGDPVRRGQVVARVDAADIRTTTRIAARKKSLEVADAEYKRNLALAQQGLLSFGELSNFESRLEDARAEYENARLQEKKGRLNAPMSGVLTMVIQAADGQHVASGTKLAEVMDFSEVILDLDLTSGEVLDVQPGQEVRVSTYASDETFEGTVERIAPSIDPTTRTFRVEVGVKNTELKLRPGMFVRAELVVDSRTDVTVVPSSSILFRKGRPVVFVVEAQRASEREVEPGLDSSTFTEILEGIELGERVVTTGQDTLQDGARVIVRG
ncbi:MAG: efflux RND transporter periplasmic adaptor subunit [Acidobacteriota bacterium]